MAGNLSFNLELKGLEDLARLRERMSPQALDKIAKTAIRYAAKAAKPAAGKAVSQRYAIGSRRVQEDVGDPYIRGLLEARQVFKRQPPTLAQFKPRVTKAGLAYSLLRGSRSTARGAFIGHVRGLRLPVVPRSTKLYQADVRAGRAKPRRALRVLHGPSIGSLVFGKADHADEIRAELLGRIDEQFRKGIERALAAQARGYG